jgi:hypothetical protein
MGISDKYYLFLQGNNIIKLKQIMKNITHKLFFVALLLFGTTIYAQESSNEDWDDLEELEEVVLVGGGVVDLAEDRVTPLAVSTITGEEIQKKLERKTSQ